MDKETEYIKISINQLNEEIGKTEDRLKEYKDNKHEKDNYNFWLGKNAGLNQVKMLYKHF